LKFTQADKALLTTCVVAEFGIVGTAIQTGHFDISTVGQMLIALGGILKTVLNDGPTPAATTPTVPP